MSNGITTLCRPHQGRWLAGVSAGLSIRSGVPVWIIRIAFFLLCFAGGLGILLYLAGWLLIPAEGETEPILRVWSDAGQSRRWVGVILVGLAVIILASETWFIRGDLAFAIVLIGIGVMLYRGDLSLGGRQQASGPSADPATAASTSRIAPGGEDPGPPVGAPTPPSAPTPPPPRETSILGRVSFGLAVLSLGVLGLFDTVVPGFHPDFHHYVALAAGVTGLGVVVGAWFGRPGGLIVLGLALVPVLVFSRLVGGTDITSVGQDLHLPGSVDRISETYRLDAGELVIDLREIDFEGRTVEVDTEVGIGEVLVRLPAGLAADVSGQVGIGTVRVGDHECVGIGVEGEFSREGPEGKLVLDAEVGMGQIVVNSWPEDDRSWSRQECR